jgi:hypothetical protein
MAGHVARTGKCEMYTKLHIDKPEAKKPFGDGGAEGNITLKQTNKLHGLSPRANYTDRATAACQRNDCQLLRIKGATWSA